MITRVFAVLIATTVLQSCGSPEPAEPEISAGAIGVPIRSTCPGRFAWDLYFPPGAAGRDEWLLRAMKEPSLSCGERGTSYRFTWAPTFDHPVAVRVDIDRTTQRATLYAVELDGATIQGPEYEARRVHRQLTKAELAKLRSDVRKEGLWSLPGRDDRLMPDGSSWMLEVRVGNWYHVVTRQSPDEGPVRRMGLAFLQLTGWQFKDVH